jgi:hypothetical protein
VAFSEDLEVVLEVPEVPVLLPAQEAQEAQAV